MSEAVGVAVVGCGAWGRNHVRVWAELGRLKAVCEPDPARWQLVPPGVEVHAEIDSIWEDPRIQGVVLATPASTHADLARRALEAGKHVLVEKPIALRVRDGEELVRLAASRGRILMVGHVLEYHPAVIRLRELISTGALGRVLYLCSNRLNIGKIRTEENALWSFAPHDVALMTRLVDSLPLEVACHGGAFLNREVADVTLTTLRFPGNVSGHIFVSWLHPFKEQRFVVVGERQMAVFDDTLDWSGKLTLFPHSVLWMEGKVPIAQKADGVPLELEVIEPLKAECQHFLECLETGCSPLTDGESGLHTLQVLDAAQHSLHSGGVPVKVGAGAASAEYWAHPSAVIDEGARIGSQTRVWHFSHVMGKARVGNNCVIGQNVFIANNVVIGNGVKIQNNVSVYEGVELEDDVFCGPSMVFTNVINPRGAVERKDEFKPTLVRKGATIGANATLVCGVTLGRHSFVGAGAVVTRDVPDFALVTGVPARRTGWMCQCGVKLDPGSGHDRWRCPACGAEYVLVDGAVHASPAATVSMGAAPDAGQD